LLPALSGWPGFSKIQWEGSPDAFISRLVYLLPGEPLKAALRSLLIGHQGEKQVAMLCDRIDAALGLVVDAATDPLVAYYQEMIQTLSAPRYQLDSRFVQLTLLVDQGPDAQGLRFIQDSQRGKYDSLATLLTQVDDRALVLLGRPGSGKTTLLRRLQLERAWQQLAQPSGPVPFFLPLNSYRSPRAADPPPDPATWLAQEWQLRQPDLPPLVTLLQAGRLLLLLDGLNEIPHRDRLDYEERIALWQLFLQRASSRGNTVVFSCRSLDYSTPLGSETTPVRQVQVEPLTPAQIESFLALYLAEQAPAIWDTLRRDSQQLALFATPFFLRLLVDQVTATGHLLTSRVALLTGFVRRALYREIQERRHRLFYPGPLLTAGDVQQVIHSRWATPVALPQQGVLMPKLARLAYAMQDGRAAGEAGQVRIPEETAHALLAHPLAGEIVVAGIQLNVLDKELARLEITYLHQLLQEYFAARVLAQAPEPDRVRVAWQVQAVTPSLAQVLAGLAVSDPLPGLPATGWEETTLLAAALAAGQEHFVAGLMAANLPLAARCAAAPEVQVSPQLMAELQQALLARIADPQADLRARLAAAEALGELGDPRFVRRAGPYGDYLLPPLAAIPAGIYTLGDDASDYDDEKPAHPVKIAAFAMGVFPVTNAEYRLFMAAGGYEDERWWQTEAAQAWLKGESSNKGQKAYYRDLVSALQRLSDDDIRARPNSTPDQIEQALWFKHASTEEWENQVDEWYPPGKTYRQPEFWHDSRFNHPSQPVVGVCWFEARAYCAWLSAQTGGAYSLPTEAEWEAAARGLARRVYAYSNDYDTNRCNTFETHIRRATPVGVFPGGQTPEGIADLSGNVWEWTTSHYQSYPYDADDGREDPADADAWRVVRGGSWHGLASLARAASRYGYRPGYRDAYFGFRVVARRPPSHDH
jgi:formylglycine-generating enzyme required for sulfatase activity